MRLGLCIALALVGCAAAPAPRAFEYAPIPDGRARLYVYRAPGSSGPRDTGGIALDHRPLADLARGEYVSVLLPPGSYRLAAGESEPARFARLPARELELRAGEALYCSLAADLSQVLVLWQFECSGDAERNAALRGCRPGALDRTVDWLP